MAYSAIGFDYGGVIGGVGYTESISVLLGIDKTAYNAVYFSLNRKIMTGELTSWREFWQLVLAKLGKPERLEEVMSISDNVDRSLEKVDTKMLALVDNLRQRGYKTGLLSNETLAGSTMMRAKDIDKHFDVFHISAETKLIKPELEAFRHFAEALGVQSDELIFIDDTEKSLSTAEECGFTPIRFKSYDLLLQQLSELGISPIQQKP